MTTYGDILLTEDRPVAYRPVLRRITGSTNAALLLAQLLYWFPRASEPGKIRKSDAELHAELGLSEDELATARGKLAAAGFVAATREGHPARMYYRVQLSVIKSAIEALAKSIPPTADSSPAPAPSAAEKLISATRDAIERGERQRQTITARANAALNLRINWDTRTGREFYRFLNERDAAGQSVEQYAAWHMADGWRAQNVTSPTKMMELWPRAFAEREPGAVDRYTAEQTYR